MQCKDFEIIMWQVEWTCQLDIFSFQHLFKQSSRLNTYDTYTFASAIITLLMVLQNGWECNQGKKMLAYGIIALQHDEMHELK